MSFLSGLLSTVRNVWAGGNANAPQKKKIDTPVNPLQNLQPRQASTPAVFSPQNNPGYNPPQNNATPPPSQQPNNIVTPSVNLASLGSNTLQKVNPRPNPIGPDAPTGNINWKAEAAANALGIAHVATSVPLGISSLVDQVTPGKGTSSVTQALQKVDRRVSSVGQTQAARSGDPESYNIMQPAANAATLVGPGDLIKAARGANTALTAAERAAEAAGTSRLVTGAQKLINAPGRVVSTVRKAADNLTKPTDWTVPNANEVTPGVGSKNPAASAPAAIRAQATPAILERNQPGIIPDVNNAPAFQRGFGPPSPQELYKVGQTADRGATSVPGKTYAAGLDPRNPADTVPAYLRRAPVVRPELEGVPEGALPPDAYTNTGPVQPAEVPTAPQVSAEHPDAAKIIAQNRPKPVEAPPAPDPLAPQPIEPNAMNDHENAALTQLNKDAKTKILTTEEKTARNALQAKADAIDAANNPQATRPPVAATTAPNAPGIRKSLENTLNKAGATNLKGVQSEHEVLSNSALNDAARKYTDNLTDDELVNTYKNGADFHNAGDIAKGVAATKRLGELSAKGNEDASLAIDNILSGAERAGSEGGRTLNYTQSFYDSLPAPAKTSYIIRQMDKIREANGQPLFRDNVDLASEVKQNLDKFLTRDESFKQAIANAENEAMNTANGIKAGDVKGDADLTNRGVELQKTIDTVKRDQSKNTSDLAKYYDSQAQPKVGLDQKIGNLGRSLMLSSPTGRANDVITTSLNSAHHLLTDTAAATIGKVVNAVTGKAGKFDSTLPSPSALVRGTVAGLKDSRARFKGNLTGADATSMIKATSKDGGKGGIANNLGGLTGKITRPVRAATEIATDVSRGVKQAKIQSMAANEGKALNLTGDDLKAYTANRTAAPSREFVDAGNKIQATVNNMQDNPITNALQRLSNAAPSTASDDHQAIKIAGQLVKNLTLPFSRWTGGQLWNGLVDNNAAVNAGKMINALRKGDRQEAINQAAKLGVNGVAAASVGYGLAKAGLLVHSDARGYSDDGTYLKVDGHYIPAGFLGFFAPGMIMGQATHDVLNGKDKSGNPVQKMGDIIGETLVNTLKSGGAASLTGEKNQILQAIQQKQGAKNVAATAGASVLSQYIPAGGRDVNAVLDNGLQVAGKGIPSYNNPNHEAALTKVTDPNSKTGKAKDVPGSLVNQLLNKIPGVSQQLPRNPGVAAADLLDRTTRGNRDTAAGVQKRVDAKTLADAQAANAKAGIPDPTIKYPKGDNFDKAVQNRIDNGKYDQAIAGLQQKLQLVKKAPDATVKEVNAIQKKIDNINMMKSGDSSTQSNGMVYQKSSNGKIVGMQQKDYDYKMATDNMASAKNSGDITGFTNSSGKLLDNISWQLKHADLTQSQRDSLTQKAVQTQEEYAKTQQYGGFTKPKNADSYSSPQVSGAKEYTPEEQKKYGTNARGYVPIIQEMGAKHGLDINALMSVAAQEGLGGGVGDGGHAFGPFQMNDAGGVLSGKFKTPEEARAYAESPQGIEDAIKQIAAVAKGKSGPDAIRAIVGQFERPADPEKEIANAIALYTGGKAVLSGSGGSGTGGSGTGVSSQSSSSSGGASSKTDKTITSNTVNAPTLPKFTLGSLMPEKITEAAAKLPTIQSIPSSQLIKKRAISVTAGP